MGIIANIKSLQGMGIYADRGARSPSLQFRRYNLVYGFNGSGKSTLSRLFASLEAGEPHPKLPESGTFEVALDDGSVFGCPTNPVGLEQRLLVFNSDFIEQNLQWAAGRANPVFYIGADQAEAANELTKVEGEIIQAEAKKEGAAATRRLRKRLLPILRGSARSRSHPAFISAAASTRRPLSPRTTKPGRTTLGPHSRTRN